MEEAYAEDVTFDKTDFNTAPGVTGTYEYCKFLGCNFFESDLSGVKFFDCVFTGCNFSLAKMANTVFRDVVFNDNKMLGIRFDECNAFGLTFSFSNCILHHSSFYKLSLKKTIFKNCELHEADFTESDLTSCVFDNCDLTKALFENSILEKADFRSARNYSIDPELNRIKKARFGIYGIAGLLDKYDIDIDL